MRTYEYRAILRDGRGVKQAVTARSVSEAKIKIYDAVAANYGSHVKRLCGYRLLEEVAQ